MENLFNYIVLIYKIFEFQKLLYIADPVDFNGCFAQAESRDEVKIQINKLIRSDISSRILNGADLPKATKIEDLSLNEYILQNNLGANADDIEIMFVDNKGYIESLGSNRAIKKTVTIPDWLNMLSDKVGIPYSQVLQEGLAKYLLESDQLTESEKILIRARCFNR